MKKFSNRLLLFTCLLLLGFTSCRKGTEPGPEPVVFEQMADTLFLNSFQPDFVKSLLSASGLEGLNEEVKYSMEVYKVSYYTTFKGEQIKASGLICYPTDLQGAAPLLSAQHGTITSDQAAPSSFSFLQQQFTALEFFANMGFVTIIPDYIGFKASGDVPHPYYLYEPQSTAVVDMIEASKEFLKAKEVEFSNDLFLFGYSEGGYATLAAQKAIEENPALDLNIVASAAGAGGYDINGIMDQVIQQDIYPVPAFLCNVIYAYHQTLDWEQPLTDFFQEPYASQIPDLFDGSKTLPEINAELPMELAELFQPEMLADLRAGNGELIRQAFTENSLNDWAPKAPVRLYHSLQDDIIPYENSSSTYEQLSNAGATSVEFVTIENGSHSGAVPEFIEKSVSWFGSFSEK